MVSVGYDTLSKAKVFSRRSFLQSLCICSVFGSPGNLVNVSQNMILDIVLERLLHLAHLVVSGHSISETRLGGGFNFFYIFTPIVGKWSNLTCTYCSDGLVQPPPKTNMTEERQPFEDAFPIENGEFPASHVSFPECNIEIIEAAAEAFQPKRLWRTSMPGNNQRHHVTHRDRVVVAETVDGSEIRRSPPCDV